MDSQEIRFECTVCTKFSKGEHVPMSYKNLGKYNMHLKSEKHLVNTNQIMVGDCLACGLFFNTTAKRDAHMSSEIHKNKQSKFEEILSSNNMSLIKAPASEDISIDLSDLLVSLNGS